MSKVGQFEHCDLVDLFKPSSSKSKFIDVYREDEPDEYIMCGRMKFWTEVNSAFYRYISRGGNIVPLNVSVWKNKKITWVNQNGGVSISLVMDKNGYVVGSYDLIDEGKIVVQSKISIKKPVK